MSKSISSLACLADWRHESSLLCGLHHQNQCLGPESPFALFLSFSALPAFFALKEKGRIMRSATKWFRHGRLFKRRVFIGLWLNPLTCQMQDPEKLSRFKPPSCWEQVGENWLKRILFGACVCIGCSTCHSVH
jgi:hypothetical protein